MTYTIESMGGKGYLEEQAYATAQQHLAMQGDNAPSAQLKCIEEIAEEFPELGRWELDDLVQEAARDLEGAL